MLKYFKWAGLALFLIMWIGLFLPALVSGSTIQLMVGVGLTLFVVIPFIFWAIKD